MTTQRKTATVAAVLVLLAAVVPVTAQSQSPAPTDAPGSVVACVSAGPAPSGPLPSFPPATVRPAPAARPVGEWQGTWRAMPAAPIKGRSSAATDTAVWNGRLYIWGGRDAAGGLLDDGAWYDFQTRRWHVLPSSGLVARDRFGFDSDNLGITIWGGVDAAGHPLADGARFVADEGKAHWESLPQAPLTPGPASISGDINATFAVTAGASPGDSPRFAVLDSERDDILGWDVPSTDEHAHGGFPAPPVPSGIAYEVADAREDLLLLSYQEDGTAVGSWFSGFWPGTWSHPVSIGLPASPGCPGVDLPTIAWLRQGDAGVVALATAASASAGMGWQALAPPPDDALLGGPLVWGPSDLIAADALLAYDIATQRWLRLPDLPDGPRTGVSAAWEDGRLYLWGGRTADGTVADTGWVFAPSLPRGTYRLPGGYRAGYGDCGDVGLGGSPILRIDRHRDPKVFIEVGRHRYRATWPDGYVVRFGDGRPAVIGPGGRVAAHDGDDVDEAQLGYCFSGTVFGF